MYAFLPFVHRSFELKFPSNLDELKAIASFLQQYKQEHSTYVYCLFCCAYLYKQTFAIPGSVFMVSPYLSAYR